MNRETTTIKIGQNTFELLSYVTLAERRALDKIFYEHNDTIPKSELIFKTQDETVKMCVVSVNGSKEIAPDFFLNMRSNDFSSLKKSIDTLLSDKTDDEKKTILSTLSVL